ncbi:hypothetical protein E2C01_096879 [Portunus trituberculatus]|uniref:Uncharacterized protein n=1 Tax=Portunus trituberculatus TaxID=210409 RepID=A0A5B7K491_PORTR|nr:hypothetical protein [Portunus trituberculatus]
MRGWDWWCSARPDQEKRDEAGDDKTVGCRLKREHPDGPSSASVSLRTAINASSTPTRHATTPYGCLLRSLWMI